MKAPCQSWYACPRGAAMYLYLTPDSVNGKPCRNWSCPNHPKCDGCEHAHVPSDKRKNKTCDFEYAFTLFHLDWWITGDEFNKLLNGCSEEAKAILMKKIEQFAKEPFYPEWLKENNAEILKKWELTE